MPASPKVDPMILAACAAKTYNANRLMAYAQLSPDLTILQVSPNFAEMAPAQPLAEAEIINQPLAEVLWEFVGVSEALHDVLAGNVAQFRLEHVNREQPDGSMNYLSFVVYALEQETKQSGLLLLVEDTTEYGRLHHELVQDRNELRLTQQKLADTNEELIKLNRMKSLFLTMAAHDLRTPLSAIHGYSDMLLDGVVPLNSDKSLGYINVIHQQSARLNQLIDDIVDLDMIEQGKLILNPSPCNINELISETITAFKFHLERRSITVQDERSPNPITVLADSEKMLRVFYNLIGNAIKYIPKSGQITLTTQELADKIIIQIKDNGPGMSEEQQNRLFTLYYRTKEAEASTVRGSGLGLFIVKTIVEAHQGQISVDSQLNQGSTFTIQLPAAAHA
ncbi:MAG: HAMP domain-containing histidine kinase [Ardenticatenaceae bacterium]|nr:HAMP domain-containing histidine kinase [Anaerolineales bacterium]MCB9009137.1 HAMP domain-containing histidine kinase [Ardenticatenaceae bacterium]